MLSKKHSGEFLSEIVLEVYIDVNSPKPGLHLGIVLQGEGGQR